MWRKSSRSNGNGGETACVEVSLKGSMFRVRDSKNKTGAVVTAPDWPDFLAAIKRGDFDM